MGYVVEVGETELSHYSYGVAAAFVDAGPVGFVAVHQELELGRQVR